MTLIGDSFGQQAGMLLLYAIPVACIAWTVTHEEIFREPREYCIKRSTEGKTLLERKFFYLFTCEYCFSHYISLLMLWMTGFHLVLDGWKGATIAFFSLVWIANIYMGLYHLLRTDIKKEKVEIDMKEKRISDESTQTP